MHAAERFVTFFFQCLLPLTFLALILYVKTHVSPSNSVPDIHSLRSSVMLFTSKPYTSLVFMGQNCLFRLQRRISICLEKHVCGKPETNGKVKNVLTKKKEKKMNNLNMNQDRITDDGKWKEFIGIISL